MEFAMFSENYHLFEATFEKIFYHFRQMQNLRSNNSKIMRPANFSQFVEIITQ